jgi:hypothetical protein
MELGRRTVVKLLAGAAFAVSGVGAFWRKRAVAESIPPLGLRAVTPDDAAALQSIMSACVNSTDAFFGKCGEWTLAWAEMFIQKCPQSVVLTQNGIPMAFMQIPTIAPEPPLLPAGATPEVQEKYALCERSRTTFHVTAAGVRYDQLSQPDSVRMFLTLLYCAFKSARQMGYQYVDAFAPWDKHPMMSEKWTDYPGCELMQPIARNQEGGNDVYWLRWQLDQAVTAMAIEETFSVA